MDLKSLINVIEKRLSMFIILWILIVSVGSLITIFMPKTYQASTTLIVSQPLDITNSQLNYDDLLRNSELAKTYSIIIKSNRILSEVSSSLGLTIPLEELRDSITVSPEVETQIIRITVLNRDPRLAQLIANSAASVFQREVKSLLKMDNVKILDEAEMPPKPINPKVLLNILVSLVLGLLVGLGSAFLMEYLDNTVKRAEDIEQVFGLTVLGVIPAFGDNSGNIEEEPDEGHYEKPCQSSN